MQHLSSYVISGIVCGITRRYVRCHSSWNYNKKIRNPLVVTASKFIRAYILSSRRSRGTTCPYTSCRSAALRLVRGNNHARPCSPCVISAAFPRILSTMNSRARRSRKYTNRGERAFLMRFIISARVTLPRAVYARPVICICHMEPDAREIRISRTICLATRRIRTTARPNDGMNNGGE